MQREGHPQPARAEWPVTFRFKLHGGRELGPTARAFADRIAADEYVTRVSEESRPDLDTVHVTALVVAIDDWMVVRPRHRRAATGAMLMSLPGSIDLR
jgi:hypothetical protein